MIYIENILLVEPPPPTLKASEFKKFAAWTEKQHGVKVQKFMKLTDTVYVLEFLRYQSINN